MSGNDPQQHDDSKPSWDAPMSGSVFIASHHVSTIRMASRRSGSTTAKIKHGDDRLSLEYRGRAARHLLQAGGTNSVSTAVIVPPARYRSVLITISSARRFTAHQ
jgi:hypothetical protein